MSVGMAGRKETEGAAERGSGGSSCCRLVIGRWTRPAAARNWRRSECAAAIWWASSLSESDAALSSWGWGWGWECCMAGGCWDGLAGGEAGWMWGGIIAADRGSALAGWLGGVRTSEGVGRGS